MKSAQTCIKSLHRYQFYTVVRPHRYELWNLLTLLLMEYRALLMGYRALLMEYRARDQVYTEVRPHRYGLVPDTKSSYMHAQKSIKCADIKCAQV